ncbi:MAG: hypothetical protein AB7F67_16075 [Rhodospirillaceae bacterium]
MTEPDRNLRADAALDALLDAVKAPAPSPALWRTLSGPGALAALQREARPEPARPAAGWLTWLTGRQAGFAFASVFGLVVGYAVAGMIEVQPPAPGTAVVADAPAAETATVVSWGTDEMGIAYAPGTAAWSAASDDEDEDAGDTTVPLI